MSLLRNQNNDFEKKLREQLGDTELKPAESLWDRIDKEINRPEFEQKVEGQLGNYKINPNPETWEQIEAQLPPEPKSRRSGRFWYSAVVLLFITGVMLGYLISKNNQPATVAQKHSSQQGTGSFSSSDAGITHQNEVHTNHAKTSESKVMAPLPVIQDRAAPADVRENPKANAAAAIPAPDNTRNSPAEKPVAEIPVKATPVIQHPIADAVKEKTPATPSTGVKASPDKNMARAGNTTTLQDENVGDMAQVESNKIVQGNTPVTGQASDQGNVKDSSQGAPSAQIAQLPVSDPGAKNLTALSDSVQSGFADPEPLSGISLTILAGAHLNQMQLSAPENGSFSNNINLRKQVETPKVDFTAGFLLNYSVHKNWDLSSGIILTNFSMGMNYGTRPASQPAKPEPGASYRNANDSITAGSIQNGRIRYTWTEIPLFVTYKCNPLKKLSFETRVGVTYALIGTVDAAMAGQNNVGVLVLKSKESFPGIANSAFAHIYAGLNYQVNRDISLGFMPYYRHSINSMIKRDDWVQQRPWMIGMSLSLRKHF